MSLNYSTYNGSVVQSCNVLKRSHNSKSRVEFIWQKLGISNTRKKPQQLQTCQGIEKPKAYPVVTPWLVDQGV